jgi:hypothetical protein
VVKAKRQLRDREIQNNQQQQQNQSESKQNKKESVLLNEHEYEDRGRGLTPGFQKKKETRKKEKKKRKKWRPWLSFKILLCDMWVECKIGGVFSWAQHYLRLVTLGVDPI